MGSGRGDRGIHIYIKGGDSDYGNVGGEQRRIIRIVARIIMNTSPPSYLSYTRVGAKRYPKVRIS